MAACVGEGLGCASAHFDSFSRIEGSQARSASSMQLVGARCSVSAASTMHAMALASVAGSTSPEASCRSESSVWHAKRAAASRSSAGIQSARLSRAIA